jgi:hypothetical protein
MKRRPWPLIAVGCLLIAAGAVGLIYHATEYKGLRPFPYELALVSLVRLLAVGFGIYLLLGRSWARWMAMAWIAFHVIVSAFHSWGEFVMHAFILALFAYALFQSSSSEYFVWKSGRMKT